MQLSCHRTGNVTVLKLISCLFKNVFHVKHFFFLFVCGKSHYSKTSINKKAHRFKNILTNYKKKKQTTKPPNSIGISLFFTHNNNNNDNYNYSNSMYCSNCITLYSHSVAEKITTARFCRVEKMIVLSTHCFLTQ